MPISVGIGQINRMVGRMKLPKWWTWHIWVIFVIVMLTIAIILWQWLIVPESIGDIYPYFEDITM